MYQCYHRHSMLRKLTYTVKTLVEIFHYYWWINELHASSHAWCATITEGDQLIAFNSKILPFRTHSEPILYSLIFTSKHVIHCSVY